MGRGNRAGNFTAGLFAPRQLVQVETVVVELAPHRVMPFLPDEMGISGSGALKTRNSALARMRIAEIVCEAVNGTLDAEDVPERMNKLTDELLQRGERQAIASATSVQARHDALRDALGLADDPAGRLYHFAQWAPRWSH